jgi:regulator of sigma E protease
MSLSILGITFIIVFHEFGHFLFAKLCKVYTPTFSIGIGKKLFTKKIGDTDFCISAGPIGGYVEIATEEGKGNSVGFDSIPYYQKVLICMGGILFNIILTYLIFTLLFFIGAPESPMLPYNRNTTTVEVVPSESPNHNILLAGDTFVSINKESINNDYPSLYKAVATIFHKQDTANDDEFAALAQAEVLRNGKIEAVTLQINPACYQPGRSSSVNELLYLELTKTAPLSMMQSLKQAYTTTKMYIAGIAQNLAMLFSGKNLSGFSGTIMALAVVNKGAKKGFSHLLLLLAIISVNLALMNLLPLPIFDGGQLVIFTIEAVRRRKLSEKTQHIIGTGSWMLMIGLLIILSIKDVYNLFL